MKIVYSGEPKDKETEAKVKLVIDGFTDEGKEYVVGVDYASKNSKDHTAVLRTSKNEDGNIVVENIEYVQ